MTSISVPLETGGVQRALAMHGIILRAVLLSRCHRRGSCLLSVRLVERNGDTHRRGVSKALEGCVAFWTCSRLSELNGRVKIVYTS